MGGKQTKPRLYEPLGKRQVRLLSIDRSDPSSPVISCQLTTHNLDEAPPYKALSYVWGDPKVTAAVILNGVSVQKTTNLIAALRRLRELDEANYWIDAICIDQENKAEKSEQVQLMGEVYAKAVEATAWLGEGTENSDLAMSFLKQWSMAGLYFAALRKQISDNIPASTEVERSQIMSAFERTSNMRNLIQNVLNSINNPYGVAEWQALAQIFKRPYWKRIWIIQELTLSRKVTLHCGKADCRFFSFIPMTLLMMECDKRAIWAFYRLQNLDSVKLHMGGVVAGMQPTMVTAGGATAIMQNNLSKLVQMTASALATDPRDRVYALLSLVPPERTVIKVDYSRTPAQVYADFVLSEIQVTNTLAPLYLLQDDRCERARKGLPSWVPDLESDTINMSYLDTQSFGDFLAAGESKAVYDVSWKRDQLSVRGVRHCMIREVDKGLALGSGRTDEAIVAEVFPRWLALAQNCPSVHTSPGFSPGQLFFRTISRDESNTGPPHCMPRGEAKIKGFADMAMSYTAWQTRHGPGHKVSDFDLSPFLSVFATAAGTDEAPAWIDDSGPPLDAALGLEMDIVGVKAQRFIRDFSLVAKTSSFFVSEDGFMGTGPKDTRPGDVVCVLLGADLPLVLRPKGRHYTLVGPCYVCGTMYGQAVEEAEQGLRRFETFKLR